MKKRDNFLANREKLFDILNDFYNNPEARIEFSSEPEKTIGNRIHLHLFYELFFWRDGRIRVNRKGQVHNGISIEERKNLLMTVWILRKQIDWTILHYGFHSYIDEKLAPQISSLYSFLSAIPKMLASDNSPDINNDCVRVLTGAMQHLFHQKSTATYEKTNTIEKALMLIENNYNDHTLSASAIAMSCGYSVQGLNVMFHRVVGCSIRQCLIRRRLSVAAFELINNPEIRIENIALSCGWKDRAYFSNTFSSFYGVPPNVFRNQVLSGRRMAPPFPGSIIPIEGYSCKEDDYLTPME